MQQVLRDLLRRELADQLALLVAQALLLEARADARVQQHRVDRLRQVVLGAHLDAVDDAVELVERRRHDHRDLAEVRVVLQLREHLVAVELGHQDVEQQQVEALRPQQVERLAAVLREDDGVPCCSRPRAEQEPVHPVVVGDQDRARGRGRSSRRRLRAQRRTSASSSAHVLLLDPLDELRRAVELAVLRPLLELAAELGEARARRSVAPFDLSVCAARRSSSASPRVERARGAWRATPAHRRGTCRSPPPGSRRRRAPAGSRARRRRGSRRRRVAPTRRRRPLSRLRALQRLRRAPRRGSASPRSRPSRPRSTPRDPPGIAFAVIAMMRGRVSAGHRAQIRRVASRPSSSGICTSISTTSYGLPLRAPPTASRPFHATSAR